MSARRIATAIVGAEIGLAGLFGAFGVLHSNAVAYADTGDPETILLSEIHNADMLPVCELEDCSDQPGQVGMWLDRDTGNWWLSLGGSSLLVVDDTAAPMR